MIYNEKEEKFLNKIIEELESRNYCIDLEDQTGERNLARELTKYRQVAAAVLTCCEWTHDFQLKDTRLWRRVLEVYEDFEYSIPKVLHLAGVTNGIGIQYADLDLETMELKYTSYIVHTYDMYNSIRGKGRIPVDKRGNVILEEIVPND